MTPQKAWENRINSTQLSEDTGSSGLGMVSGRNVLNSNAPQITSQPVGSVRTVSVPPLPPRPPQLTTSLYNRPSFGIAPSMFGGYSGYGGGYGGYSSYGNYPGSMYMPGGYGYGSYGQPSHAFENSFLQLAEESSRGAFQSIESLVRTFTSVSMMLESTYHAMYSSFRAILGVVDNFSRLRQMFAQFLSAIAILRIIRSFYRRLLYWLGMINHNPQSDQIWEAASAGDTNSQVSNYSSWPLFTFIGLLFGGPYLISKLFSSNSIEQNKWDIKKGILYKTSYPHEAASAAELSFNSNEILIVAPGEFQQHNGSGWLLAANQQGKIGYVPINRLSTLQKQFIRLNQGNVSTTPTNNDTTNQTMD